MIKQKIKINTRIEIKNEDGTKNSKERTIYFILNGTSSQLETARRKDNLKHHIKNWFIKKIGNKSEITYIGLSDPIIVETQEIEDVPVCKIDSVVVPEEPVIPTLTINDITIIKPTKQMRKIADETYGTYLHKEKVFGKETGYYVIGGSKRIDCFNGVKDIEVSHRISPNKVQTND